MTEFYLKTKLSDTAEFESQRLICFESESGIDIAGVENQSLRK